jgi:hypothetical protein
MRSFRWILRTSGSHRKVGNEPAVLMRFVSADAGPENEGMNVATSTATISRRVDLRFMAAPFSNPVAQ